MAEQHLKDDPRADGVAVDAAAGLHECACGCMTSFVIEEERDPTPACSFTCAGKRRVCTREEHEKRWHDDR